MKQPRSSPDLGTSPTGFALICDRVGKIISIVRDGTGLPGDVGPGRLFPSIVSGRSAGDALEFLEEVATEGAAFNRELALGEGPERLWFRFSGCLVDGGITILASQVDADALIVEMSKLNNDLVNSQRELARGSAELSRLSEERMELLRELRHRDKNSFNMISSLISLSAIGAKSPEAARILGELDGHVRSVASLYSLLNVSESFTEVRLDEYCAKIASEMLAGKPGIELVTEFDAVSVSAELASPVGLILTELITNILKYAFPSGRSGKVMLTLNASPAGGVLVVADDGVGLPADFNPEASGGLGMGILLGLAAQIGGSLAISGDGGGTRARLEFLTSKRR